MCSVILRFLCVEGENEKEVERFLYDQINDTAK